MAVSIPPAPLNAKDRVESNGITSGVLVFRSLLKALSAAIFCLASLGRAFLKSPDPLGLPLFLGTSLGSDLLKPPLPLLGRTPPSLESGVPAPVLGLIPVRG